MITRLYVDNFRSLVNFELKLDRLNLLAGANGSGKSNVFEVLRLLQDFQIGGQKVDRLFSRKSLTRWQTHDVQTFAWDVTLPEGNFQYSLSIKYLIDEKRPRIEAESLKESGRPILLRTSNHIQIFRDDASIAQGYSGDWEFSILFMHKGGLMLSKYAAYRRFVEKLIVASINPTKMRSETNKDSAALGREMEYFATYAAELSHENLGAVIRANSELKEIIPGFENFEFKKAGDEIKIFQVILKNGAQRNSYAFDELSDGQRVVIALYLLIFGQNDPAACLFLDECDNYVALRELQPWLAALQDALGSTVGQAVLISHHPEIINGLGNSRIRWFSREGEGPTRVTNAFPVEGEGLQLSELVARGWTP